MIDCPGLYDLAAADYHADPCPAPSLSRSVLKQLVDLSAAHACVIHPKFGGLDNDPEAGSDNEVQDYGTAAHASFLQNRSIIKQLDFRDWKTNAAKAARAQAYADGLIPLLTKSYGRAMRLIDVLEAFRARTGAFTAGKPEQTVVWQDGPIWCRARPDWLPDEPSAAPWDLKTTAGKATLAAWSRVAFDKGADLQDVFYCRGLEFVRGEPPEPMQFCVVEQKPPHGIRVFAMSPIARASAEDDVRVGLRLWENCVATGLFPNYPDEPEIVFPPSWIVRQREERGQLSRRVTELLREQREVSLGARMIETGDFGG